MQQAEGHEHRRGTIVGVSDVLRAKFAATLTFCRYALHRFNRDGCFGASGALSYTTLVSLVPLGVIALGILSVFPNFPTLRHDLLAFTFPNFLPPLTPPPPSFFPHFSA